MPRRAELRKVEALGPLHTDNLVMADGERHRFLRKIASYAFTPRAIGELEDQVKRIAADLFDQIPDEVEVDFVDTVAAPLPMIMIALMLGVPIEDLDDFRRVVGRVHRDVDESTHAVRWRTASARSSSSASTSPSSCRTASPTRATTCSPSSRRPSGTASRSSIDEQLSMAQILLIAGNETTRGLIAGAGQLLAEQPDQRRLLVESPELIPGAVEEFLRYVTPVTHMCRTALDDTEIRGQQIAKGDFLCLLYPAANRDEDVWERADELDVTPRTGSRPRGVRLRRALLPRRQPGAARGQASCSPSSCRGSRTTRSSATPTRTRQHMTPGIKTMPVVFHR